MKKEPIIAALVALTPLTASAYFKYIPAPQEIPGPVSAPAATPATPVPLAEIREPQETPLAPTPVEQEQASAMPVGTRYAGAPSAWPKMVTTDGIDRFSVAVAKIAPPGWTIENRIPVGMDDRAVEWSAGRPWPQTLDVVARDAGRSALIDWDVQAIIVE